MAELNMAYFEELRERINLRLVELQTPHRDLQIREFPWLYGALGAVPSETMFICENPSIAGVRKASVDTIDGAAPDIESQWWGGRNDRATRRFRRVLCEMGLKTSPADARGGWNCYITNVVKEANVAGADQRAKSLKERCRQAEDWADILRWELERVQPRHVFCVGTAAFEVVTRLQAQDLLPSFVPIRIAHYSARGRKQDVLQAMRQPLKHVLGLGPQLHGGRRSGVSVTPTRGFDPEAFAQRQLDAYNDRDLQRFVDQYTDDVEVYRLPSSEPVLVGKAAFAEHYRTQRFNLPELHAELVNRMVFGSTVIDHERVSGVQPTPTEVAAIYEVTPQGISKVWFVS